MRDQLKVQNMTDERHDEIKLPAWTPFSADEMARMPPKGWDFFFKWYVVFLSLSALITALLYAINLNTCPDISPIYKRCIDLQQYDNISHLSFISSLMATFIISIYNTAKTSADMFQKVILKNEAPGILKVDALKALAAPAIVIAAIYFTYTLDVGISSDKYPGMKVIFTWPFFPSIAAICTYFLPGVFVIAAVAIYKTTLPMKKTD